MPVLPDPFTPPDCDLRGMPFMPLDTNRLLDSDFMALATAEEFRWGFTLWCKAWQQVPAGSLPDDDRILAHLSGARDKWCDVRDMSLHGFVKCSDGRLYHPVICEKAIEALPHRQEFKRGKSAAAERKERERTDRAALFEGLRNVGIVPDFDTKTRDLRKLAETNNVTISHSDGAVTCHTPVTAIKGTVKGQGQVLDNSPSDSSISDADPPEPPPPLELLPVIVDQPDDAQIAFDRHDALRREFTSRARSVELTAERKRLLAARLHIIGGLSAWDEVLAIIRASPFLRGDTSRNGFVAVIDWLLKPANLRKVQEGNYDHDEHAQHPGRSNGRSVPRSPIDGILAAHGSRAAD
ncbi:MAG: hypothetical protein DI555_14020 [Novosphingobium pentaromativorans]|uniref:DUF1376 domain-containing protein n=1 Tax=Novosphingobium pentaromativorans TaxID=205844 RepID=A0A2W5NMK0_9SPHN|nr:MAG: hypothetical protein DI555_14020 [Novosphingobium pentaromativorans]